MAARGVYSEPARMPDPILPFDEESCQICGEPADDEMGEFSLPRTGDNNPAAIYAHGQCGLDHRLQMA